MVYYGIYGHCCGRFHHLLRDFEHSARYVACFLFACVAYAVNSVILGWISATLGQTPEKKAALLSIVNVITNASYIYTAYLYPKSDGPPYLTAMSANAAFGVLTVMSAWGLRIWLQRTNRKIRDGQLSGGNEGVLYAYWGNQAV